MIAGVDAVILLAWTMGDPLKFKREVLTEDQYGNPTQSVGPVRHSLYFPYPPPSKRMHSRAAFSRLPAAV